MDGEQETLQESYDLEIIDIPRFEVAGIGADGHNPSVQLFRGLARPTQGRSQLSSPFISRRLRLMQLLATSSVVILALLLMVNSVVPLRDVVLEGLFGPTSPPPAMLYPGWDLFYIQIEPSWMRTRLDGQELTHLPIIGTNPPLRLTRGQHQLEWFSAPFATTSCTFLAPPTLTQDTCHHEYHPVQSSGAGYWVITFTPSLATFSDTRRIALISASQAALDRLQGSTIVQPGEQFGYWPNYNLAIETATQPLQATLHFRLDTDSFPNTPCLNFGQFCVSEGLECRQFCTPLEEIGSPSERSWEPLVVVYVTWQYEAVDGHIVAQDPLEPSSSGVGIEYVVALHILWDSTGWHVSIPPSNPYLNIPTNNNLACASAQNDASGNYAVGTDGPVDWSFKAGANGALGCLGMATLHQGPLNTSTSANPIAYCLHRLDLFVALNDVAHHFWPTMPMANAYEQRLAQQLGWKLGR